MSETNSNLLSILNELIRTCKDGQEGFHTAAQNIDDPEVKLLFNELSLQRAKFAGELQNEAHLLGNSMPEHSSSVAGTLHRGWINIKTAIVGKDANSILSECERGEDSAVAEYEKIVEDTELPRNILDIVERQLGEIRSAHDRVRDLRNLTGK